MFAQAQRFSWKPTQRKEEKLIFEKNERRTKYLREFSSNTRTLFSFFSFFLAAILKNNHWKFNWVPQAHIVSCSQISHCASQGCSQSLKTKRARNSNKMADISDKNVNILSRFTKLPDKNQATVLVSLEIILSYGVSCFFLSFFSLK